MGAEKQKNEASEQAIIARLPLDIWGEIIRRLPTKQIIHSTEIVKPFTFLAHNALKQKLANLTLPTRPYNLWRQFLLGPDAAIKSFFLNFGKHYISNDPSPGEKLYSDLSDVIVDYKEFQVAQKKFNPAFKDYFENQNNHSSVGNLKKIELTNQSLCDLIEAIEAINNLELALLNVIFEYLHFIKKLQYFQTAFEALPSQVFLTILAHHYLSSKEISVNGAQLLKKLPVADLKYYLSLPEYQAHNELINVVIFAINHAYLPLDILDPTLLLAHSRKSQENAKFMMGQKEFFNRLAAATQKSILNNLIKHNVAIIQTLIPNATTLNAIALERKSSKKAKAIEAVLNDLKRAEKLLTTNPGIQGDYSAVIQQNYQTQIKNNRNFLTTQLKKTIPSLKLKYAIDSILLGSFIVLMPILVLFSCAGIILGAFGILPFFIGLAIFIGCAALLVLQLIRLGCGKAVGVNQLKSDINLEHAKMNLKENIDVNITLTTISEPIEPPAATQINNDNAAYLQSPVTAAVIAITHKSDNLIKTISDEFPEVGPSALPSLVK